MKGGVLVGLVAAASLALPAAASAPKVPRGFAADRFTPVSLMRQLPTADWRAAQGYMHWAGLSETDTPVEWHRASETDTDFGVVSVRAPCVQPPPASVGPRIFALAGLGRQFDFIIYRHSSEQRNDPAHDHLLVFRRLPSGERTLAWSCVGKLPRRASAVSAAVAAGRCREAAGLFETR